MIPLTFEIDDQARGYLEAQIRKADRFADCNRAKFVLYMPGARGASVAELNDNKTDENGPRYYPGAIVTYREGGRPGIVVYAPAARDIDKEIYAARPDAFDYSNNFYKHSKEYAEMREALSTKMKSAETICEIIRAAFKPHKVIFTQDNRENGINTAEARENAPE